MPADGTMREKGQIPTNLRLLIILEEVARVGKPMSAAALSDALELPRPTMHRLLATAEEQGFLQRDVDGRSYGPGRRMRKLAASTLSSQRIRTERLMIMKRLAEAVGETCNLAAPGRHGMIYLDRVETHWPLRIQLPVGTQVPFHCTASGKMYLASLRADKLNRVLQWLELEALTKASFQTAEALLRDLEQTSARGYATDREEFMDGMVAIAVPIQDGAGRLLTTLSIHAPTQRRHLASIEADLPKLLEAAAQLAALV